MQILALHKWFAKKRGIFASIANSQLHANHKSKQILLVSKVLIIYCLLCATEKSYQKLGLRVSSGYPNTPEPSVSRGFGA